MIFGGGGEWRGRRLGGSSGDGRGGGRRREHEEQVIVRVYNDDVHTFEEVITTFTGMMISYSVVSASFLLRLCADLKNNASIFSWSLKSTNRPGFATFCF